MCFTYSVEIYTFRGILLSNACVLVLHFIRTFYIIKLPIKIFYLQTHNRIYIMKDDNIELFLFPETLKKNYSIEVSVGNVKRQ